jgi:transketolase
MDRHEISLHPAALRKRVLNMAFAGNSVHIGCAFSLIEILAVLYSRFVRFPGNQVDHPERDFLILSKGHGVMAQYACLEQLGFLEAAAFDGYFSDGSALHGLCEAVVPGCEVSSGSMGHGFAIAAGIAYGLRYRGQSAQRVYCVVGDGEMNEGPMWEAALFAAHHRLNQLVVIVDANGLQAMGKTSDIIDLEPLVDKFCSFGFETAECDGHNIGSLQSILEGWTRSADGKPKALIARTIKGKGVSFMEGRNEWHYLRLKPEQTVAALAELEGAKVDA